MVTPFRAHLAERADRVRLALTPRQIDAFEAYVYLLNHWNKRINLTALDLDPPSNPAIDRLLIEPLVAARYVPDSPIKWFDLGSGGGSPAIPLKIVRPAARLAMIESRSRKAAFLREAARELKLDEVDVLGERFEDLLARGGTPEVDLITARAVRIDLEFERVALALLGPAGRLFLFESPAPIESPLRSLRLVETVDLLPDSASKLIILAT